MIPNWASVKPKDIIVSGLNLAFISVPHDISGSHDKFMVVFGAWSLLCVLFFQFSPFDVYSRSPFEGCKQG